MPELEPNEEYYAAVNKDGQIVGGVYREEEYAQQVLEAAYSRDNSHIIFNTYEELEIAVQASGYKIKKVKVTLEE